MGSMPFGFRIRYLAPPGTCLENAATEQMFVLPGSPQPLVLRHVAKSDDTNPTEPEVFTIDSDGFADEDSARRFGRKLKTILSVYSARHGLGFDLGEDQASGGLAKHVRDKLRADYGKDLRPTVHGLDVYDTSVPTHWLQFRARVSIARVLKGFPNSLTSEFKEYSLNPKQVLALTIYNASHHETDPEVRFLALITVVEVLVEKQTRSPAVITFLNFCKKALHQKNALTCQERKCLRDGLGRLKKESIGEACTHLVRSSGADVKFFRQCYTARSDLLHEGESKRYPNLTQQFQLLDNLVRQVLNWVLDTAAG